MEENNLTEKLQVNENIKDSIYNENQNSNLISKEEYGYIKIDIQTLNNMSNKQKMINKVYMILKPESIENPGETELEKGIKTLKKRVTKVAKVAKKAANKVAKI